MSSLRIDEIGELAARDRALLAFLKLGERRAARVGAAPPPAIVIFCSGNPAVRILAVERRARRRRIQRQHRVERRDRPVGPERQPDAFVDQRPERVGRLDRAPGRCAVPPIGRRRSRDTAAPRQSPSSRQSDRSPSARCVARARCEGGGRARRWRGRRRRRDPGSARCPRRRSRGCRAAGPHDPRPSAACACRRSAAFRRRAARACSGASVYGWKK